MCRAAYSFLSCTMFTSGRTYVIRQRFSLSPNIAILLQDVYHNTVYEVLSELDSAPGYFHERVGWEGGIGAISWLGPCLLMARASRHCIVPGVYCVYVMLSISLRGIGFVSVQRPLLGWL
jgi:hypothetical protein